MAPLLQHLISSRKLSVSPVLLLLLLLVLFASSILAVPRIASQNHQTDQLQLGRRRLLKEDDGDGAEAAVELPKKKPPKLIVGGSSSAKNKTKLLKPLSSSSVKNETKLIKPISSISTKNHTKLLKPIITVGSAKNKTKINKEDDLVDTTTTKVETAGLTKTKIKKINSTSSTKPSSILSKKSSDLIKTPVGGAKNKTNKTSSETKEKVSGALLKPDKETNPKDKTDKTTQMSKSSSKKQQASQKPNWMYESDDEDLVSEIRELPSRLQQSFVPDLHRISTNSKIYLTKANKDLATGFKPYVGNRYAPTMATALSCGFILIPLVLVSLIINRFKAYFSIQKLVIFVQVYLAIYFSILCLSSLVTGLEPLRFFYSTSQSTYIWLQVLQTLGYIMYLLLLLMYLVLLFSSPETGLGSRFLGLGQTFVGFAVGLHYYVTVFHRVVLRQPPRTNWKVHGIYATCFIVVCLFATADRRKKAYLEEGGQEGKKN